MIKHVTIKRAALSLGVLLLLPALAYADCAGTKSMIHDKIQANGVQHFSLEVIDQGAQPGDGGKVVGTCEGGKQIVYTKGGSSSDPNPDSSSSGSMSDNAQGGLSQPASSASSGH